MAKSGQNSRAIWPILASLIWRCVHPRRDGPSVNWPGAWAYTLRAQRAAQFAGPAGTRLYSLYGLALVSASEAWAVGSDGLIVHGHAGTWTQVASPTDQTLWSVVMVAPTEGWAVGDQGTILHYQSGVWSQYQGW